MQSLRSTGLALLPLLAMLKPVKMSNPGEFNSGYINCMVDSDSSGGSGDTVSSCSSSSQPSASSTESSQPTSSSLPLPTPSGNINTTVDGTSSGGSGSSGDTVPSFLSSSQPSSSLTSSTESPQATSSSLPLPTPSIEPSDKSLELSTWLYPTLGGVGVLIAIGIVICCIILICVIIRKRKEKPKKRQYWESTQNITHGSGIEMRGHHVAPLPRPNRPSRLSLVSRGHYLLENLSCPLSIEELGRCIEFSHKLYDQYMTIPANMTNMNEVPTGAEDKNRYRDVLPNPNTRVVLFLKFGVANSDFINANFIRGYKGQSKAYIATQGPLAYTVADFWRMIWEQRTTVIIMTTELVERDMVKCNQYWPDPQGYGVTEVYGEIQVTVRRRVNQHHYILTTFVIQHLERFVTREVFHYWYKAWPDHGVPTEPGTIVDFLLDTRRSRENFTMPGPTVVHCSAGIGRTGVFIAADIGMRELEDTKTVDVLKIVANLRQDRGGMVQTKEQYLFLHKVLFEYAKRIGYVMPQTVILESDEDETDSEVDFTRESLDILIPSTFRKT